MIQILQNVLGSNPGILESWNKFSQLWVQLGMLMMHILQDDYNKEKWEFHLRLTGDRKWFSIEAEYAMQKVGK